MAGNYDFFNAVRVRKIISGLYDPRLMPQPLVWDRRIPSVPAMDDEILSRFIGVPMIADLIADDAEALTYSFGKFQFESYKIPVLKIGIGLNQKLVHQLNQINGGFATDDQVGVFQNWENRILKNSRYSVDVRREALLIAMLFDGLSYNRLGIILNNVNWGMYPDLKITVATTWDTAASATPVNDIFGAKLIAKARYGIDYDRITMSTTAFRYMVATTEFQNKARLYLAPNVSYTNLTLTDIQGQLKIAGNVLGMEIELDDRRFWSQDVNGVTTSTALWPTAGVVLSSKANDGNSGAWDFANGMLDEKAVAELSRLPISSGIPAQGPAVYWTPANSQLNPPGITCWGVQRGFPRKHMLQSNCAMTVGTFGDSISTAPPF